MNKALLGLLLGGILGVLDGLSAWFTPAVRNQLLGIVIGSTVKGLISRRAHRIFRAQGEFARVGDRFWAWYRTSARVRSGGDATRSESLLL
jgi:hypothetical protein